MYQWNRVKKSVSYIELSIRTNRRTKGKFSVTERRILKELGIKDLTPRVDRALAFYRDAHESPAFTITKAYLKRWRELTKDFTEEDWDELARRVNLA